MKTMLSLMVLGLSALTAQSFATGEVKNLPQPVIRGGMPLMDAINTRYSERFYNPDKAVDDQTLSEILWAAWGQNTAGKRTIPTARNEQNMNLYLLQKDGTWKYDAAANTLTKVNDVNLIPLCAKQDFVNDAPVQLLYTAHDDQWGRCHVGSAYQNVYLYCTSKGLGTVIRGLIDADALTQALGLTGDERVIAHQTVGYPAED